MSALAIIAALPRELSLLAANLDAKTISNQDGILLQSGSLANGCPILLVTAGMGSGRVALAVAAALAHGPVDTLLSVGLAGACDPQLTPGTVLEASLVIDTQSGERFTPDLPLGATLTGTLVTTPKIAGPTEKQRLRATYNAAIVDMEAAMVARLARAHNIRFAALKSISDDHAADLSHLVRFAGTRGHFRTGAFALHTAVRPHRWRPTVSLGRNTNLALRALTGAIHQFLLTRAKGADNDSGTLYQRPSKV